VDPLCQWLSCQIISCRLLFFGGVVARLRLRLFCAAGPVLLSNVIGLAGGCSSETLRTGSWVVFVAPTLRTGAVSVGSISSSSGIMLCCSSGSLFGVVFVF